MKIDIIIPNYNGSHLIKKNLEAVLGAQEGYQGKVIIVDDGSSNEDREELRKFVKNKKNTNVVLVEHLINKGFSSAINTGVSHSEAKFVVLLNSDVVPRRDFLKSLVEKMQNNSNLFGLGCMDESIEGDKTVRRGRGIGYWKNGMVMHKKGENNKSDTFWISGGSCILRRDLFNKLNGMDAIYNPFYWEDIDLSFRAVKSGYEIGFDNRSIVRHYHDEGAIRKSFSPQKIGKIAYRNQFIFIWKNITSFHLMVNHFVYLPSHLLKAIVRFDIEFLAGLFLALQKLPAIIKKRNLQKKHYKVSDVKILGHIS